MCPKNRQKAAGTVRQWQAPDAGKSELLSKFQKEQKKLENMVEAYFARGSANLGTDACILNQSVLIDKLVVDQMMLEDFFARRRTD